MINISDGKKWFDLGVKILIFIFILGVPNVFGWSQKSHDRMAYWAAYYRGWPENLPGGPFTHTDLKVEWKADIDFFFLKMTFPTQEVKETINFSFLQKHDSSIPSNTKWTALEILTYWASMPDPIDEPTAIAGGGLIAHMYTPTYIGYGDQMCQKYFDLAVKTYPQEKGKALAYLAMAIHYLEDMGIPIHCELDYLNPKQMTWQIYAHNKSEAWVDKNWYLYFDAVADKAGKDPLPVCDVAAAARSLALASSWELENWKSYYGYAPQDPTRPAKEKEFVEVVKLCIKQTVPRIAGLLDFFAIKVGIKK